MNPIRTCFLAAALVALAAPALAQEELAIDVDRSAAELADVLKRPVDPVDPDLVETALVFTTEGERGVVVCAAHDSNGNLLGTLRVRVPANGLRYLRGRDFSGGADYVGSANCRFKGPVVGSAFLLGPGFSDLPARQRKHDWRRGQIIFPVVASY